MKDLIVKEIELALARTSPGAWYQTPYTPAGEHAIFASSPAGGSTLVGTIRTKEDAFFAAHAKGYITHLLRLLEEKDKK